MSVVLISILVTGCTASVRVMPTPDNFNRVIARDIEKHGAEKAAHRAAVRYCEDHDKEAVFISEQVSYEGDMDEAKRTLYRKQAKAAAALGGVIRAADHTEAATVLEGAGAVGATMTSGKDYTAEVTFQCAVS